MRNKHFRALEILRFGAQFQCSSFFSSLGKIWRTFEVFTDEGCDCEWSKQPSEVVSEGRRHGRVLHLPWSAFILFFFFLLLISWLALDPNIKLAYAADKWDEEYFESGLAQLEEMVIIHCYLELLIDSMLV
jgi:hypothetical protein